MKACQDEKPCCRVLLDLPRDYVTRALIFRGSTPMGGGGGGSIDGGGPHQERS